MTVNRLKENYAQLETQFKAAEKQVEADADAAASGAAKIGVKINKLRKFIDNKLTETVQL